VLDHVRLLGLPGNIDASSLVFETLAPGKIHPLRASALDAKQVRPL
jgi:hypothetical protein